MQVDITTFNITDEELSDLMVYYAIINKKNKFEKIYTNLYPESTAPEVIRVFSLLRYGLGAFVDTVK